MCLRVYVRACVLLCVCMCVSVCAWLQIPVPHQQKKNTHERVMCNMNTLVKKGHNQWESASIIRTIQALSDDIKHYKGKEALSVSKSTCQWKRAIILLVEKSHC